MILDARWVRAALSVCRGSSALALAALIALNALPVAGQQTPATSLQATSPQVVSTQTRIEAPPLASFDERWERYRQTLELPHYRRGDIVEPQWLEDGRSFIFAEGSELHREFLRVTVAPDAGGQLVAQRPQQLLQLGRLFPTLEKKAGPAAAGLVETSLENERLPFSTLEIQAAGGKEEALFDAFGQRFRLDLSTYRLTREPHSDDAPGRPQLVRPGVADGDTDVYELAAPDGRRLLTEIDGNLWIRSVADGAYRQVTTSGTAQDRFEVDSTLWSPDGLRLLTVRVDRSDLRTVPVVHWLDASEVIHPVPYTRSGGTMERYRAFTVDLLTGLERPVAWERSQRPDGSWTGPDPEADAYLLPLAFENPGEARMLRVNRTFDRLDVLAVDSNTGAARVLLTETSPTFIEGLRLWEVWAELWTPLADGGFLWLSERSGWRHVYRYDADGALLGPLTAGNYEVRRVVAVDEDRGQLYLMANAEANRPYDTHLYRVSLDPASQAAPTSPTRLTQGDGEHTVTLSPSREVLLDRRSAPDRPPTVTLRAADDGRTLALLSRAEVKLPQGLEVPKPEPFRALAADGATELHGWLFRPSGFDPQRRYPVLDYIYNGPFITWSPQEHFDRRAVQAAAVAQMGYVVAVLDGRGTPERGKAFQDVVYRNFGQHEVADHAAALRHAAASRPWMDLERVGIYGGSWGGYMTQRALLTEGDLFGVGVATAPVADLWDHNQIIEAYMGPPTENVDAYEAASNLALVEELDASWPGKLLVIHGTSDINAPFSSTMKLVDALVRAGIDHDQLILPNQTHWFDDTAEAFADRARLRHFEEHLHPERRPAVALPATGSSPLP